MIEVEKESRDLFEEFGAYERCVYCGKETQFWHVDSNTPVCQSCAQDHTTQKGGQIDPQRNRHFEVTK